MQKYHRMSQVYHKYQHRVFMIYKSNQMKDTADT